MSEHLSQNTKAILLLTAPLIVGRGAPRGPALKPLTLKREYSVLARRLHEIERQPADLLGNDACQVLDECLGPGGLRVDPHRIESLLGRGVQLSLAVERWQTRAIWVLSRADDDYPRRLKRRLREHAPPVLYGCGDRSLADRGGLAVVGPRDAGSNLEAYAQEVGELAARSGRAVVSGGAKGVDRAAMTGALNAGGWAVGVLANNLARASTHRENRDVLLDGRLVLVSPYDPAARFFVSHAMERNHSVYGLADAALVVEALVDRGGTWAGAIAQLGRCSGTPSQVFVSATDSPSVAVKTMPPVYVRSTLGHSEGLAALADLGALPWPNPETPEDLGSALYQAREPRPHVGEQSWPDAVAEPSTLAESRQSFSSGEERAGDRTLADQLWREFRVRAWSFCREASKLEEVASAFDLTIQQAKEWLGKLVEDGVLRREKGPVRYLASETFPDEQTLDQPDPRHDAFWHTLRRLAVDALAEPAREKEVADRFQVGLGQARRWQKRLVEEGALERFEGPVRHAVPRQATLPVDGGREAATDGTFEATTILNPQSD